MGVLPISHAQTYKRTEIIEYHDDLVLWVLGQLKKTTCVSSVPAATACDGEADSVLAQTDFGWAAMPSRRYAFGKLEQMLGYDSSSALTSGQLGTLRTVADGNSSVTTLSSWKRGIPQSIKYPATPEAPAGATRSAVVNDNGWIDSAIDENGFQTTYQYDAMGRLRLIDYPDGDTVNWHSTSLVFESVAQVEYGIGAGHWRQTVSTGNARKVTYFDALWRPLVVREFDASSPSTTQRFSRFTYDSEGRVTFASYPGPDEALTSGTWTWYDALGRPYQVTQDSELGALTTRTDYLSGFRTRVTSPRGHVTTTHYQAWDVPTHEFPTLIEAPEGAVTTIVRDGLGTPLQITRSDAAP